jgi:hypothetical protein
MPVSMNGPGSPTLPLSPWILVTESHLWSDGLPVGIALVNNPDVCAGEPCLAVFVSREDAQQFIDRTPITDARPLLISDLVVFIAILNSVIRSGLRHVVQYAPEHTGPKFWAGDADELLKRLSEEAKSRRG